MNTKVLFRILFLTIFVSCVNKRECKEYEFIQNQSEDIDSLFFLAELFIKRNSKKLITTYENEIYRVWFFHSLNVENYIVEYEKMGTEAIIRYEKFELEDSSQEIKIIEKKEKQLSSKEWEHINFLVDRYDYWYSDIKIERTVTDGYVYFLEGSKKSCNQKISKITMRTSPDYKDNIGNLSEDLLIIGERLIK